MNTNEHENVLRLPYRGATQTVAVIREAATRSQYHLSVRQLAESWCHGLGSKDYLSELLAVYFGVLRTTRYMRDPRPLELVRAPHVIAKRIIAGDRPSIDCDDSCALLVALVMAMGAEARVVTVAFRNAFHKGKRQYSHVYCQAREPRTTSWVVLDPVAAEKTKEMLERVVAAKVWPV